MAYAATSVHTEETSCAPHGDMTYGQELRLNFPNEWPATADAYSAWDREDYTDRLSTLEDCRSNAWFAINVTDHTVIVLSSACRLRWCPLCAQARANYLRHSVGEWYNQAKAPKLLTLTLRHEHIPLELQLNNIYGAFFKLRRCKYMSSRIRGGIWFFQITWSEDTDAWHPHIHALIDSNFIPQSEISERWSKYTDGSNVVDIRSCWSPESAANHVARYATRPGTLSSVPPAVRVELLRTLHGRRIVGAWGSGRAVSLAPPKAEDKDQWRYLGSWQEVRRQSAYNFAAKAIILAWKTRLTLPAQINIDDTHPYQIDKPFLKDSAGNEYYSQSMYDT